MATLAPNFNFLFRMYLQTTESARNYGGSRSCSSMVIPEPKGGCEGICCSESESVSSLDETTRTPEVRAT